MAIAQWNDSLATGVDKVDTQHKEIIRMINESHEALSQGKGRVYVEKAIGFLSSYVVDHFNRTLRDNPHLTRYPMHLPALSLLL